METHNINFSLNNFPIFLSWDKSKYHVLKKFYMLQTGPFLWNVKDDEFFLKMKNLIEWNFNRSLFDSNIDISKIKKVLDVGSGLSLFDLTLSQMNPDIDFYLLDKSDFKKKISQYYSKNNTHGFYNLWFLVDDCIKHSNLNSKKFNKLSPDDNWPTELDLVISLNSWCWHYPKEVYWEKMISSLKIGGYLILDVLNLKDKSVVDEITNELGPVISSSLRPLSMSNHPFKHEFNIVDNNVGGCYCWQRIR